MKRYVPPLEEVIRLISFVVALVLVGLVFAAGSARAQAPKEIVIGASIPKSGVLAAFGTYEEWGYKTAVNEVNKAGGLQLSKLKAKVPVRLVLYDDESRPEKVTQNIELRQSTRTAAEAARAVGCAVGQIVKSLVFRAAHTDRPVLVIASGANRVNEKIVGDLIGEPLEKAHADFVRARTGFSIGGVPPIGHAEPIETFVDEDLSNFSEIWAAAGTPNAVFRLTPADLVRLTTGRIIKIT